MSKWRIDFNTHFGVHLVPFQLNNVLDTHCFFFILNFFLLSMENLKSEVHLFWMRCICCAFLNNRSVVGFADGGGGRVIKLMLFVDIINVRPLSLLNFKMFKSLG